MARYLTGAQEQDFKGLINEAFKAFRKAGYVARQRADAYDMTLAVKNDVSKIGWIGYDRQGAETIPYGTLYLSFEGTVQSDMGRALLVGRDAVKMLKTIRGVSVEWDEKPEHSIKVIYLDEFERNKPITDAPTPAANKETVSAKLTDDEGITPKAAQVLRDIATLTERSHSFDGDVRRPAYFGGALDELVAAGLITLSLPRKVRLTALGTQYATERGWLPAPITAPEPAQTAPVDGGSDVDHVLILQEHLVNEKAPKEVLHAMRWLTEVWREYNRDTHVIERQQAEIRTLESKLAAAAAALEFYADGDNYYDIAGEGDEFVPARINGDWGEKARETLAALKQSGAGEGK